VRGVGLSVRAGEKGTADLRGEPERQMFHDGNGELEFRQGFAGVYSVGGRESMKVEV